MATETRYIVKVLHYSSRSSKPYNYYWLSDSNGITMTKDEAYKYTAEELKNHSKAYILKYEINIVLIPVQVKKD